MRRIATLALMIGFLPPLGCGTTEPVYVDKGARARPHAHPRGKYSDKFPDVVLVDHEGKKHRFYSDLVRDRIVVIQFFYTVCTGI